MRPSYSNSPDDAQTSIVGARLMDGAGVSVGAGLGAALTVFDEHRYVEKHW